MIRVSTLSGRESDAAFNSRICTPEFKTERIHGYFTRRRKSRDPVFLFLSVTIYFYWIVR